MPQSRREQIIRNVITRCQAAISPTTVLRQHTIAIPREQTPVLLVAVLSDAPVTRSNDRMERELVLRILAHEFRNRCEIGDGELHRVAVETIKSYRLFDAPEPERVPSKWSSRRRNGVRASPV